MTSGISVLVAPGVSSQRDDAPLARRRWIGRLLSLPLTVKLAGASAIVVAAAIGTSFVVQGNAPRDARTMLVMIGALGASLVVNMLLVLIALRPIRILEITADRVARGDLDARVPPSPLADPDVARVGRTFNRVLDALIADRAGMRRLASAIIREGDRQRASISRELHDSSAQSLAALMFEVTAAIRSTTDVDLTARLETIHTHAVDVLDEVRLLAQRVHPRVLDDLGLVAGLDRLARGAREVSGIRIDVSADLHGVGVPAPVASVLYRIAEEAVANAVRHGSPKSIGIQVNAGRDSVRLAITDDGRGFDADRQPPGHPGVGLFTMRQRAALAGGIFEVESRPGAGSVVSCIVPLGAADIDAG